MNNDIFNNSSFSFTINSVYPKDKGIILIYDNGETREIYGREHVIMMQEIGYWYTDNWQDFLLNFSYNGIIVIMIEFDTSLVYLPKNISDNQKKAFNNYIEKNVSSDKRYLLNFFVILYLEKNNKDNIFTEVERNKRGMIKQVMGEIVNDETAMGYNEICNYLDNNGLIYTNKLKK